MEVDKPISLYLNTAQISTSHATTVVANEIGSWDNGRQTFSFNIKMRQLLGDTYNKYDKFIISLVQYQTVNQQALAGTFWMEYQMGGLPWVNSSYDQATRANSYWTPIFTQNVVATSGSLTSNLYDILSNTIVFNKGDPEIKLEFRVIDASTRALVNATYLPTVAMFFKILPYEELKK